jgi:uncharacterized protein YabE (DUF348 family)
MLWGKRMIKVKLRKLLPLFIGGGLVLGGWGIFQWWPKADHFTDTPKTIFLSDNGLPFTFQNVSEKTVGEFLSARHLELEEHESVFPSLETTLAPGMTLLVERTHPLKIKVDGGEKIVAVHATSVTDAIEEAGITLDEDDIVNPGRDSFAYRDLMVSIIRVDIREETVEKSVAFEKKVNEDSKLSWRKSVVTQKGVAGTDRLVYRVSSHDGKEVNRKLLRTERIKDPVPEIVTQGTYVQLGKSHTGAASWYSWTGTMAAANPWLPKGSYVKVTNLDNGKSVIVVINDRGPFVPGRIIDLDKVAFAKIASIGAGVINVKMEEITN